MRTHRSRTAAHPAAARRDPESGHASPTRPGRGPLVLFAAWTLHDIEEALTFPDTCEHLRRRTGIEVLGMTAAQSWAAVGLMGMVVGGACVQGTRTRGRSRLYRAVLAGLEAHVTSHIAATVLTRRYTAGVATALPVMLPGALLARRDLARAAMPLEGKDYLAGAALLIPAALACHALVRLPLARLPRR